MRGILGLLDYRIEQKEDRGLLLWPEYGQYRYHGGESNYTPLYLFAHFENGGLGDEVVSDVLEAMPLLLTGKRFDMVVDMAVIELSRR